MASENTEYLSLTVYPDISGVYQTDLRLSYYQNYLLIDAFAKAMAEKAAQLKKVAFSGKYEDIENTPDIPDAVPIATQKEAGKVKPDGITIMINEDGVISATCEIATTEKAGIVKPDGDTIAINKDGTIRVTNDGYSKEEVDTMLQELSAMLMSNSDFEMLYNATNALMGDQTEFTGLGASLVKINALADELLT